MGEVTTLRSKPLADLVVPEALRTQRRHHRLAAAFGTRLWRDGSWTPHATRSRLDVSILRPAGDWQDLRGAMPGQRTGVEPLSHRPEPGRVEVHRRDRKPWPRSSMKQRLATGCCSSTNVMRYSASALR